MTVLRDRIARDASDGRIARDASDGRLSAPHTVAAAAPLRPLNATRDFVVWPPFDPGRMIDLNAGYVRLGADEAWAVFCRHSLPPIPGEGSLWAVRVDAAMLPIGAPVPLIGRGMDPRVIRLGERVLVFFAIVERNAVGLVGGSFMALTEFRVEGDTWTTIASYRLPTHPIERRRAAEAQENWEKNWVPFAVDDERVALIYAHDPWDVITLNVAPGVAPRFDGLFSGAAVQWDYGTIRGGTPPVAYDDGHLVTFFHAAQVIGSRRVYSVGACVLRACAPYTPVAMTREPLLLAPYRTGVHRFGWPFAISAVFPLGAEADAAGYRLLCGRDDGEIARFEIDRDELAARLAPPETGPSGTVHDYRGGVGVRSPLKALLYVPDPIPGIPELPMVNFLRAIVGGGRSFVDVGSHIGFFTMGLAPRFARVIAFEPSRQQYGWLRRNAALNDYDHVECAHVALGEVAGDATLHVLSYEGGLNTLAPDVAEGRTNLGTYPVPVETLDARGLTDVDLLKIDVEGYEIPVLKGAARTIAASRPVILIEVWDDAVRRDAVRSVLEALDYTFEFQFPRSPELAICLPRERRSHYAWFI